MRTEVEVVDGRQKGVSPFIEVTSIRVPKAGERVVKKGKKGVNWEEKGNFYRKPGGGAAEGPIPESHSLILQTKGK